MFLALEHNLVTTDTHMVHKYITIEGSLSAHAKEDPKHEVSPNLLVELNLATNIFLQIALEVDDSALIEVIDLG